MRSAAAIFRILCLVAVLIGGFAGGAGAGKFEPGDGSFEFTGWPVAPLTVWYTAPGDLTADMPVVMVMHGVKRNGADYRDQWADLARLHGFLLLVPEFPQKSFPRSRSYNLGNVLSENGEPNPPGAWTYGALDPLFEHVKSEFGLTARGYALYGHSAGAQFVHRFLLFQPHAKVLRAVAANAGWYTMPTREVAFPYGFGGTSVTDEMLAAFYAKPLTLLLGEADTDPADRNLRQTPEAQRQGPHRFARGRAFFAGARSDALSRRLPFGWSIATASGIGHDNARMAPFAVSYLLHGMRSQPGPVCRFPGVTFRADFAGGRLDACAMDAEDTYRLTIRPETIPVNPSPWYAFTATARVPRNVNLLLHYPFGRHRYHPKAGREMNALDPLPPEAVEAGDDPSEVRLTVPLDTAPLYIAGQNLIPPDAYARWRERLAGRRTVRQRSIGRSEEGRPIEVLEIGRGGRKPAIIIVGRQHPPEMTGAQALFAFTERLLEDDGLAKRFRRNVRIVVMPDINPDGVARGHWRHNVRGVDLNRDWGPFTQAETRAARDAIFRAAGRRRDRLALFLDFHSTREDVLYTQHDPVAAPGTGFTAAWVDAMQARLPDMPWRRDPAHNPASPVAKNWVHETFGIAAITYEVGDETPEEEIVLRARVAAEEMMKLLLAGRWER